MKFVKFEFRNITIEKEIITSSFTKTDNYYSQSSLKHVDDNCKFTIPYDIEIADLLKQEATTDDIPVCIKDGSAFIFSGYVRKSVAYTKTQRNQPISIEIVSPSYLLNKTAERNIFLTNKNLKQILTALLDNCGFSSVSISENGKTFPFFLMNEGDNYRDVIDNLCFECGYVYDFDSEGAFYTSPLFNQPSLVIQQKLNGNNLLNKIQINQKEQEADWVEAKWKKIKKFNNTLLFEDTQNQDYDYKCLIAVPAGSYAFGKEHNYLDFDSTEGTVLYVESINTSKVKANPGVNITCSLTDNDGKTLVNSAYFSAYNSAVVVKNITQMDIFGDAWIELSEDNISSSSVGKTKKKPLELRYLHTDSEVEDFIQKYANYLRYASFTISVQTHENFETGSFVEITDDGIGTFKGRIIQKKTTFKNSIYSYTIESVTAFEPAEVTTKTHVNAVDGIYDSFEQPLPPVMRNVAANADGTLSVNYSKSASKSAVTKLYRKIATDDDYALVTEIPVDGNKSEYTYIDREAEKGVLYNYYAVAVAKDGKQSEISNIMNVTGEVTSQPALPTNVVAEANNSDYIHISFTAADSTGEAAPAYYLLEISRDSGTNFTAIGKIRNTAYDYFYDRTVDGYPEKIDLALYRFRLKTYSINDVAADGHSTATPVTTNYKTWIPSIASAVTAVAEENGIRIKWSDPSGTYGTNSYFVIVHKGTTARTAISTAENENVYPFDRNEDVDGYPEKADLEDYRIAIKTVNAQSKKEAMTTNITVDASNYLAWKPFAPNVNGSASGRNACLIMTPNAGNYGHNWCYRVQIKKVTATADTGYFKPNLSDDPYADEDNYKYPDDDGYETSLTGSFQQALPLKNQATSPADTIYSYSVIAVNESGAGDDATTVNVTATATGATDIVNSAITAAKIAGKTITYNEIADNTITADQIKSNTISTENLNVLAKNRINNFSVTKTLEGWNTKGVLIDDTVITTRKMLKLTTTNGSSSNVYFTTNNFTVNPSDILCFEFEVEAKSGSAPPDSVQGIYIGLTFGQRFYRLAYTSGTGWTQAATTINNAYFISGFYSTTRTHYKTYILGYNADINAVPAPIRSSTATGASAVYALRLKDSATTCCLRTGYNTPTAAYEFHLISPEIYDVSGGQICASNLAVFDLAATNAYISKIAGNKGASTLNYWSGLDGLKPEFRVGNETEYIRFYWNGNASHFDMVINNFVATSVSSIIKGVFHVTNGTASESNATFFSVNPTGSATAYCPKSSAQLRGQLFVRSTADASLTNDTGALVIGASGSTQVAIDNNEIMARNNGAAATLGIQYDGGNVVFGTNSDGQRLNLTVNGGITIRNTGGSAYLEIRGGTVSSNTYDDVNPKLIFKNSNASQNISLTFTDYDAVQAPASLTLNGNQGNEFFITPNLKIINKLEVGTPRQTGISLYNVNLNGGGVIGASRITFKTSCITPAQGITFVREAPTMSNTVTTDTLWADDTGKLLFSKGTLKDGTTTNYITPKFIPLLKTETTAAYPYTRLFNGEDKIEWFVPATKGILPGATSGSSLGMDGWYWEKAYIQRIYCNSISVSGAKVVSYVGMIIISATFNTEAKVKAFYGGTTWVKITGNFLYGVSSGAGTTGGGISLTKETIRPNKNAGYNKNVVTDLNQSLPPYFACYIWRRTA